MLYKIWIHLCKVIIKKNSLTYLLDAICKVLLLDIIHAFTAIFHFFIECWNNTGCHESGEWIVVILLLLVTIIELMLFIVALTLYIPWRLTLYCMAVLATDPGFFFEIMLILCGYCLFYCSTTKQERLTFYKNNARIITSLLIFMVINFIIFLIK